MKHNNDEHPLALQTDEQVNPTETFREFFDAYQPEFAREFLTRIVETSLTTENEHFETALDRANLIHFYHLMEGVLEAAKIISCE